MIVKNRQIVLAARPEGLPKPSDFRLVETPVPELAEGQFLLKTNYLSVDPYMRGRISEAKSYAEPVAIGEVMVGGTVGTVVKSQHPGYRPGEVVVGYWGWQEYAVSDGQGIVRFDTSLAPMSTALGVLGMPGMTAYFGLLEIGKPKAGDTVFVSGAAGAVGSLVGQIAKIKGASKVVGIAGTKEKCAWIVDELGFDAAVDYRDERVSARLRAECPEGIDVYFDNVGGPILDTCLAQLAMRGRVVLCGAISLYNAESLPPGPANYLNLLMKRGRMEGFIILDYVDRFPEAQAEMFGWVAEGKVRSAEHFVDGLEHCTEALNLLFTGGNTGKVIVRL